VLRACQIIIISSSCCFFVFSCPCVSFLFKSGPVFLFIPPIFFRRHALLRLRTLAEAALKTLPVFSGFGLTNVLSFLFLTLTLSRLLQFFSPPCMLRLLVSSLSSRSSLSSCSRSRRPMTISFTCFFLFIKTCQSLSLSLSLFHILLGFVRLCLLRLFL